MIDPSDLLRDRGIQVTAQRLAVLRAVSTDPHITADAVAARDDEQQAFIVRLLGRTADIGVVEMLIDRLIQDTPALQGAAAEALGYIGDTRAVSPLLLFLGEESSELREIATEALGRLGDTRAVTPVLDRLQDENEWVRRAACVSLGMLGDQSVMEALTVMLQDETVMVQDAAFEAMTRIVSESDAAMDEAVGEDLAEVPGER